MANPVLDEILEWSNDRAEWQRDALRRLFTSTAITPEDLDDLVDLCKAAHGLVKPRSANVLGAEHLAMKTDGSNAVSLISVTHHRGVNALAPEQTVTFGPNLTIVFGSNAAGKSGYTRILKRACRSRQVEEILGDVLHEEAPLKPRATIKFRDGTSEQTLTWEPIASASDALTEVDVFDAHCAPIYLRDKTDVAFRPFGLDVFDSLSAICGEVRGRLEREYAALDSAVPTLPVFPAGTRPRSIVDSLTFLTKIDAIRDLATLSSQDKRRLKELLEQKRDLQATDPKQRAKELSQKAGRIDGIVRHLNRLTTAMGDVAIEGLRAAGDSIRGKREAVAVLRKTALTPDLLTGTGEDAWSAMWEATEVFSQQAYPDSPFPAVKRGARCPFCQQPIGSEAQERLRHFAEYVSSNAQTELHEAEQIYSNAKAAITDIPVDREDVQLALNELSDDDADLAMRISEFLQEAARLQEKIDQAKTSKQLPLRGIGPAPDTNLRSAATTLRDRALQLQSQSSAMEPKAAAELSELESRALLNQNLQAVENEIERKKQLAAYKQCLDDTSTVSITRKSTELTKRLITDQLRKTFQEELSKINFTHLAVEIQPVGGAKGSLYHRLVFTNAPGVAVTKVVSEGESRALSLAAFLTELSTATSKSTVIFDDPVSSLDHVWRERIARRLVAEAAGRQVIVFTHDILFLRFLLDECSRRNVPIHHQYVRRDGQAGLSSPDLPWIAMRTKDRIGALHKRWQMAERLFRTAGNEAYERDGREIYGLLCEAWEQAVGEILLGDVIERYRHSIETRKVRDLHDITEQDCRAVDEGMTECSRWIRGHDQPPADATPFPSPAELEKRIEDLESWVAAIKKRRK